MRLADNTKKNTRLPSRVQNNDIVSSHRRYILSILQAFNSRNFANGSISRWREFINSVDNNSSINSFYDLYFSTALVVRYSVTHPRKKAIVVWLPLSFRFPFISLVLRTVAFCSFKRRLFLYKGLYDKSKNGIHSSFSAERMMMYTVFQKVVHQAHIDNLVNSQRIIKISSRAHSLENLR